MKRVDLDDIEEKLKRGFIVPLAYHSMIHELRLRRQIGPYTHEGYCNGCGSVSRPSKHTADCPVKALEEME